MYLYSLIFTWFCCVFGHRDALPIHSCHSYCQEEQHNYMSEMRELISAQELT